jgi:hypothetical protein
LAKTAESFSLACEWNDDAPVAVACHFPAQPGLDFDLWLSLSDDEFVLSGEEWNAFIFPADDEFKWGLIVRLVEGLVSGEARVVLYRAFGWSRPYWTELQLFMDGQWRSVSTGIGCAIPPIMRPSVIRNGHPTITGGLRLAPGSAIALLGAVAALYCTWFA